MKRILNTLYTILFAASLACLNAPMFDHRKHEIFAETSKKWFKVKVITKTLGLKKFKFGEMEVWASNIEKATRKYAKQAGVQILEVIQGKNEWHVLTRRESYENILRL